VFVFFPACGWRSLKFIGVKGSFARLDLSESRQHNQVERKTKKKFSHGAAR
jgi:hypothetical protein